MRRSFRAYTSMVVADSTDIRLSVFAREDDVRKDLIEWFNDHVSNGGLDPDVEQMAEATPLDEVITTIRSAVGRNVIIEETFVVLDR